MKRERHRRRLREHMGHRSIRRFVGARLHRRLFVAMGVAIFLTLSTALGALWLFGTSDHDSRQLSHIKDFFSLQFADVWHDEAKRSLLAERARMAFSAKLSLRDASGQKLQDFGGGCENDDFSLTVQRAGQKLGSVLVCPAHGSHGGALFGALTAAGMVLWLVSGFLAHKMGRPLWDLVLVTREIGEGNLQSRARLGRHHQGEVGVLAASINEMASRIERQISDQKELLAGVSHEIRTPLARLRVLTEILRDAGANEKTVLDTEREIAEIDDLTGRLLATSRLDFDALELRELDGGDLGRGALERLGYGAELLVLQPGDLELKGDATLLGRALLNLLMNAKNHAGGPSSLTVERKRDTVQFVVADPGPGFDPTELGRVFDSFYRGSASSQAGGSLGLGLSLVRRIARAHGGDAFAENPQAGGARVGFWVRVGPSPGS